MVLIIIRQGCDREFWPITQVGKGKNFLLKYEIHNETHALKQASFLNKHYFDIVIAYKKHFCI